MRINVSGLGKRFNHDWIFRKVSLDCTAGSAYAITGANGSGKSTLLQVIAGALMATEGEIHYTDEKGTIAPETLFSRIAIAAPYLELIEEMTATELLRFHARFKPLSTPVADILDTVGLHAAAHRQIRYYSSGMKQRLKLAQAFFSNADLLLLDEPTNNLDAAGIALYQSLLQTHTTGKLVLLCSNDPQEYRHCTTVFRMEDWKA
jgi:ABC-type multidrug transport system ATPase subunit